MKFLLEKLRRNWPACIAMLLCPIATFYLFDGYTHNPFTSMDFQTQLLNMVFYELAALFLLGVFRSVRVALMVESAVFMLAGLANYYVLSFRSAPIMPWDILSWRTAATVADNYDYSLEPRAMAILAGFLVLLIIESRFKAKVPGNWKIRLAVVLLPALMICGYTKMVQNDTFILEFGLYDKLFTPTVMSQKCGNTVAFLMEMEYLNVAKPDGYSAANEADKYQQAADSAELKAALADPESVNRPNIIVIMNEAFSDLSVLGELVTNEDYMPFIRSLQQGAENTVTGYANVSVLGGNTANSEFEFLTGGSMAFLPQGSVVYQQYLKQEMPNLVSYLKDLGYSTVAMHPYNASGWERDRVYPMLGFDEFISLKNMGVVRRLRKYVTDEACYDRIISLYEKKEEGQPLFVFNVTMQNHSSYTEQFDNFTPGIEAEGTNSEALNMYLSLMKESDRAFEELIKYFSEEEEDTIILFFGDHQPTSYVSNPVFRANGIDPNNLTDEQNMLRYKVPYVLWSNFDMQGDVAQDAGNGAGTDAGITTGAEDTGMTVNRAAAGRETSLNYLPLDLLKASGLPLPASMSSLEAIREEYPVVTAIGAVDKEGTLYELKECEAGLNAYQSLEYYLLFDYEE